MIEKSVLFLSNFARIGKKWSNYCWRVSLGWVCVIVDMGTEERLKRGVSKRIIEYINLQTDS